MHHLHQCFYREMSKYTNGLERHVAAKCCQILEQSALDEGWKTACLELDPQPWLQKFFRICTYLDVGLHEAVAVKFSASHGKQGTKITGQWTFLCNFEGNLRMAGVKFEMIGCEAELWRNEEEKIIQSSWFYQETPGF